MFEVREHDASVADDGAGVNTRLGDGSYALLRAFSPVARTAFVVGDRDDEAISAVGPIDQPVRKPCQPALAQAVFVSRPPLRSLPDAGDGLSECAAEPFLDRSASESVPASRLATLGDRVGVKVNDPSGHPKDRRSASRPPPTERA